MTCVEQMLGDVFTESARVASAELAPNYVANRSLVLLTTDDWSQYDRVELGLVPGEPDRSRTATDLDFTSPFLEYTPLQIARILREDARFPRENVSIDFCVILDQQTIEDGVTALLVRTCRVEGENLPEEMDDATIVQWRGRWADVEVNLLAWDGGEGSMEEMVWNEYEESRG